MHQQIKQLSYTLHWAQANAIIILFMEIFTMVSSIMTLFLLVFGPILKWFKTAIKVLIPGQGLIVCHYVVIHLFTICCCAGIHLVFSSRVRSLIISFYSNHYFLSICLLYKRYHYLWSCGHIFQANKLCRLRVTLLPLCWLLRTIHEWLLSEEICQVFLTNWL